MNATPTLSSAPAGLSWLDIKTHMPPEDAMDHNPEIKFGRRVLVTNNINAKNSGGQMSHVWFATPIWSEEVRQWIAFCPDNRTIENLTHWMDPLNVDIKPNVDAQPLCLPPSIRYALEFYAEGSASYPGTRHEIEKHEQSPDWEKDGEIYEGRPRFKATTVRADVALRDLEEWIANAAQSNPELADDDIELPSLVGFAAGHGDDWTIERTMHEFAREAVRMDRQRVQSVNGEVSAQPYTAMDDWKRAVDNELVSMQATADSYSSPNKAVAALIEWHVAVATDPKINPAMADNEWLQDLGYAAMLFRSAAEGEAAQNALKALREHASKRVQPAGKVDTIVWPEGREAGRMGDMTPLGESHLRIGLDADNDVYVAVFNKEDGVAAIEFCTGAGGGGKSPRTRAALIAAMVAMEADNEAAPSRSFPQINKGKEPT